MMRFGRRFEVELFGASHAPEVGVIVRGVPVGTPVDRSAVQAMLDRRRPVGRRLATKRQEEDELRWDAGVEDGIATGGAIRAHVDNTDARPADYRELHDRPRPGHADFPARARYGPDADLAGGGIFSGRMTVGLVIAGALARSLLQVRPIDVLSFTTAIGDASVELPESLPLGGLRAAASENEVGCPDAPTARAMEAEIAEARREGDSVGGIIETRVEGTPVGLGEPFFDSVESEIAHLAFSVPAVKAIEFGAGFRAARLRGSTDNDPYYWDGDVVRSRTNHAGGVLGGLATGMPLRFRVAVKPTSSIAREQETVDLVTRRPATIRVGGRHDPCIVPRAVVVIEAITWIALADLALEGGFLG